MDNDDVKDDKFIAEDFGIEGDDVPGKVESVEDESEEEESETESVDDLAAKELEDDPVEEES